MMPRFFLLICALLTFVGGSVLSPAQMIRMRSAQFDPLKGTAKLAALPAIKGAAASPALQKGERRVVLVQWGEGLSEAKLNQLKSQGIELILPIPEHAYLVSVPAGVDLNSLNKASSLTLAAVTPRWAGTLEPAWKLDPRVSKYLTAVAAPSLADSATTASQPAVRPYNVQLVNTGAEKLARGTMQKVCKSMTLRSQWENFETWKVEADPAAIQTLAGMNSVFWIEPSAKMELNGERAGLSLVNSVSSDGSTVINPGSYQTWLNQVGLSGAGVTVQVMDDGLSQGNASNQPGTAHLDILGRIAGIDNATGDPLGNGVNGHGHINASIIMGQPIAGGGMKDAGGYLLGQGVAPQAKVYATKVFVNNGGWGATRSYASLVGTAYQAGARVSSNSWNGSEFDVMGLYTTDCQDFDRLTRDASSGQVGLQAMIFCFSAGNQGRSGLGSVAPPATSKNVISVGASENTDKGEMDGCGVGEDGANDLRDIADFSSRGPTSDRRIAPTIVAPGTHVTGAASDDKDYNGSSVCGRLNVATGEDLATRKYYPDHQTYYTWSSGTSHSCPTVAGAVALYYEYYLKKFAKAPSPALVKAALVAGAVDPVGGNVNDRTGDKLPNVPNDHAGWGRATLKGLVDGTLSTYIVDQATVLTYNGQSFSKKIQVADPSKPMRVVLAWTDPPASPLAMSVLVNNLDLTVSDGTNTWKGNMLANGESKTGGSADTLNNIECVFLPKPTQSVYTITVTASDLNGDALPGSGGSLEQDFALYVSNGADQTNVGRISLDHEFYNGTSQALVSVTDSDLRSKTSTTVTATSQPTGDSELLTLQEVSRGSGVMNKQITLDPSGSKSANDGRLTVRDGDTIKVTYTDNTTGSDGQPLVATDEATIDALAPGVSSHSVGEIDYQSAKLTVIPSEPSQLTVKFGESCGSVDMKTITISDFNSRHEVKFEDLQGCTPYFYSFTLTDRAGNSSSFNNVGNCFAFQTLDRQNLFEDTLEPTAKSGWSHSAVQGVDDWRVRSYGADTTDTNHAWFASDVDVLKDASLVTPSVFIQKQSMLVFYHTYEFETGTLNKGFDGGVVEITVDNGQTWQDLGAYMLTGWYDSVISIGSGNPLAGRKAWSGGTLGALMPVAVDLSAFANRVAKFRFRIGCDEGKGAGGWYIDDIYVRSTLDDCIGRLALMSFDQGGFSCSTNQLRFTLRDMGLSETAGGYPINFRLASTSLPLGLPVVPTSLNRLDPQGFWEGFLKIEPGTTPGSVIVAGQLELKEGETLKLIYTDPDVNGFTQDVITQSVLDCTPATLTGHETSLIQNNSVTFKLSANEPVKFRIKYGTSATTMNQSAVSGSYKTQEYIGISSLNPCTTYFYQIDLIDQGGNVTSYNNDGFGYAVQTTQKVVETDTFDPQVFSGWMHYADLGTDSWSLVSTTYAHSSSHAWFAQSSDIQKDTALELGPLTITSGEKLRFWHTYNLEKSFDGAVIEISTDDGKTWKDLGEKITTGQYNLIIAQAYGSPIAGRSAWSDGALGAMTEVVVDLSSFAGSNRWIRWRMACDKNETGTGWYIDDVTLESVNGDCNGPGIPGYPVLTGPANGITNLPYTQDVKLTWDAASEATSYRVYCGPSLESMKVVSIISNTSLTFPAAQLKAGTTYFWRVVATNSTKAMYPSAVRTFRTVAIAQSRVANHILGKTLLSSTDQKAVDYDDNGVINVADLITCIKRK